MTYTHKMSKVDVISKDKSLPKLVKERNGVEMHDHYTCNYNKKHFLRHLHNVVKGGQLTTLVADHSWGGNDDIQKKYSSNMFDQVIPMLARISFWSKDGEMFLPYDPWIVANVYKNEKMYRYI